MSNLNFCYINGCAVHDNGRGQWYYCLVVVQSERVGVAVGGELRLQPRYQVNFRQYTAAGHITGVVAPGNDTVLTVVNEKFRG